MLPYHQSWLPPLTRSRHTQISTRTLISFERKETLKKKKNSKFQIIHTFIKNFQIFSQFLNLFPQNSVSTFNFHRPILSRFRDIRMKMIFTRFEKKEIYYREIIYEILFYQNAMWKGGDPQRAVPKDLKRESSPSFLRAFISSFLFRGFSLNVETASHYRSFVARDVNKRGTSKREMVHRPSSDSSRGIDYPSRNCFSFSRNRCCND